MRRIITLVLALSAWALLASPAAAENFRCGQYIASPDMTVEELLRKCGKPTRKTSEIVDVYAHNAAGGRTRTGTSTIEKWTYDRGPQSFAMVVTIEDGAITSMERAQ